MFDATAAAADQSTAIIEYHNKQFFEELVPKYRQMLALFTERYHFADAETRKFYPPFLEYVVSVIPRPKFPGLSWARRHSFAPLRPVPH